MVYQRPLVAAVPDLSAYRAQSGIGRVVHSLLACWGERVRTVGATFEASRLPLLRNCPFGVRVPDGADLVLLPKLLGARALRDTKAIPSLIIVHDMGVIDFAGDRDGMDWFSYRNIVQNFCDLRFATYIATDSYFTRQRLIEHLPEVADRVTAIPAGVGDLFLSHRCSQQAARSKTAAALHQSLGAPLLLYVGSEVPRKNMPLLLQSFRRIKDRHPGAQLLKVGRPGHPRWRAKTLRLARELGLRIGADILIWEGASDAALADAYRAADVFVSASLYEGFGLPALEALAVGAPVVVTNRGSFPEVVGDAGRVVAPELEPFTEAIEAALADPLRDQRSLIGRARAATFSWTRAAERYLEVMGEICGRTIA